MHECLHGHPTRRALVNEALVLLPLGLVYPYRRFRALHLRHHADERLTDPFEDPESYYRARWRYEEMPGWARRLLGINNTMAGRFVLGPAIMTAGFLAAEMKLIREDAPGVRRAWLLLGPAWLGQSLISVRTFAEHQWSERPDGRTIIVERSPLALLFLNNNLHLAHHKMPGAPWYRLPALYRARRAEWLAMNDGYSYPGYFALAKDFAFRTKEPVPHPALRRAREAASAFRPRAHGRSMSGTGSVPVPARPVKE